MPWLSQTEKENVTTAEFAPETFKQVYKDAWFKTHKVEAAVDNPNPEAELEIIDEVKNETKSVEPMDDGNDGGSAAADAGDSVIKIYLELEGSSLLYLSDLFQLFSVCLESRDRESCACVWLVVLRCLCIKR